MQLALSFSPSHHLAVSRRRIRGSYRRLAFKAFPRLMSFIVA